jgi:hypothetical protein
MCTERNLTTVSRQCTQTLKNRERAQCWRTVKDFEMTGDSNGAIAAAR